MNFISRWYARQRLDRELADEMAEHIRERAEELMEAGRSPEEAQAESLRHFGNVTLQAEKSREAWGWNGVEQFARELQLGLRSLRKSPGFALTAFLTLALGIGASTAVFTLVDSVILRPLAYRDSGRLVVAWERVRFLGPDPVGPNPRHADLWQKRATAFSGLTLLRHGASGLAPRGEHPFLVGTVTALPNLFGVLEVDPQLGRAFRPEDGIKGRDQVALITDALWTSRFQRDPHIVGQTIRLAGTPRLVIGVLPAGFHFPSANTLLNRAAARVPQPAIFLPATFDPAEFSWDGEYGNWVALGRLRPGVTIAYAQAQLNAIEAQLVREHAVTRNQDRPGELLAFVQPMQEAVVGEAKAGLWLLLAAVLGLMLLASLNLANAQLGRALSRRREVAVRSALGASRWRLVSNALAESLLLAFAGCAAGVLLASSGLKLLELYSPLDLPRLSEARIDTRILLFAVLLTAGSTLLFAVAPLLRSLREDPQGALQRTQARTLGSRQSAPLRWSLIGAQVAGCTVLLFLTGLFASSLLHLLHGERGFQTEDVVVAEADLGGGETYADDRARIAFDDAVLANLRSIPGVRSAGMISAMPLEGESWIEEIRRADRPDLDTPLLNLRWTSPGYFETVGQKLIAGRLFEERDRNLHSAILSEGEAAAVWPHENALGAALSVEDRRFTVIGIVADSRSTSLKTAPPRMAYLYYRDRPPYADFFLVRSAKPSSDVVAAIRKAIWRQDPGVTIARVKTLSSQVNDSLAAERFRAFALISFGAAALALAMLGIYGVLSYAAESRRQEIGVRMAMGATRANIYRLTLFEAGLPVLLGLLIGLGASFWAARLVANLLYGVKPVDLPVSAAVLLALCAAAFAASFVPARRAASIDPLQALRAE